MAKEFREITRWKKKEIQKIFDNPKNFSKKSFFKTNLFNTLRITSPPEKKISRLLIITPKKIGNAVKRNLFKRRLKSIFYQKKFYKNKFDYIFFVKKEGLESGFQEIEDAILRLFDK